MIAPEGIGFVLAPVILLAIFIILALLKKGTIRIVWTSLAGVFLLLFIFMLFFFRDPVRVLPGEEAIVSPTDGTILTVDSTQDGGIHIIMFLSLANVHAIRTPVSGKVIKSEYIKGKFHAAWDPKAGTENEHHRFEIEMADGRVVVTRVIAGIAARRVVCHLEEGDEVVAGQRVGFIRFGSRSELEFPPGFTTGWNVGDKVSGGITPIGQFEAMMKEVSEPDSMSVNQEEGQAIAA